ncbi:hypothetical protein TIFTF001_018747 [Ficus carica]|uniref:Uncharacterized protein n=1 Tax=Ficus carica TaxID=3494 RepID=A0AA88ABM7_FICCA|nr:hypothetical protein TIFTF001_018747 [Ficus carica]
MSGCERLVIPSSACDCYNQSFIFNFMEWRKSGPLVGLPPVSLDRCHRVFAIHRTPANDTDGLSNKWRRWYILDLLSDPSLFGLIAEPICFFPFVSEELSEMSLLQQLGNFGSQNPAIDSVMAMILAEFTVFGHVSGGFSGNFFSQGAFVCASTFVHCRTHCAVVFTYVCALSFSPRAPFKLLLPSLGPFLSASLAVRSSNPEISNIAFLKRFIQARGHRTNRYIQEEDSKTIEGLVPSKFVQRVCTSYRRAYQ